MFKVQRYEASMSQVSGGSQLFIVLSLEEQTRLADPLDFALLRSPCH